MEYVDSIVSCTTPWGSVCRDHPGEPCWAEVQTKLVVVVLCKSKVKKKKTTLFYQQNESAKTSIAGLYSCAANIIITSKYYLKKKIALY